MLVITGAGCKRGLTAAIARRVAPLGTRVLEVHCGIKSSMKGVLRLAKAAFGHAFGSDFAPALERAAGVGSRSQIGVDSGVAVTASGGFAPVSLRQAMAAGAAPAFDKLLVLHRFDRVLESDGDAALLLLQCRGLRIVASAANPKGLLGALGERHRIGHNLLVFHAPTYLLASRAGITAGAAGGRAAAGATGALSRHAAAGRLARATSSESIACRHVVVNVESRAGVRSVVDSLPPAQHHMLGILLGLMDPEGAASSSAAAPTMRSLPPVPALELFSEAREGMVVTSEAGFREMLRELGEANLIHTDTQADTVALVVQVAYLRAALQAQRPASRS